GSTKIGVSGGFTGGISPPVVAINLSSDVAVPDVCVVVTVGGVTVGCCVTDGCSDVVGSTFDCGTGFFE
ncbi:MAG TPA: hypothetical protein PL060_01915, partial [bacterium]|nr:hypothetical protein [bacterium]